jgi:hypothetical protein
VTYDLTACTAAGVDALHRFATDFDDMLERWRQATTSALAGAPVADRPEDHPRAR